MALLKSSIQTMTKLELIDFISREFPGYPHSVRNSLQAFHTLTWFTNIGFPGLSVWAIQPSFRAEIESDVEAIYKEKSLLRKYKEPPGKQKQQQPKIPKSELNLQNRYFQTVNEVVQVNTNGCSVDDIHGIVAKHGDLIHLHCPDLKGASFKIKITDFHAKKNIQYFSIDPVILAEHHRKILDWTKENEAEVKASMKNPQDFDALLRGELKHGYDLCPTRVTEDVGQLLVWCFRREKPDEIRVDYPHAMYSKEQLIVLAFQNSHFGRLTLGQILDFSIHHFRGYHFHATKDTHTRVFRTNLKRFDAKADNILRMTSIWKPLEGGSEIAKVINGDVERASQFYL